MLKAIRRFSDAANVSVYTLSLAAMIFLNNAVYPFCPLSLSLPMALLYNDIVILSIVILHNDNDIFLSIQYIDIGIYLRYNSGIMEDRASNVRKESAKWPHQRHSRKQLQSMRRRLTTKRLLGCQKVDLMK